MLEHRLIPQPVIDFINNRNQEAIHRFADSREGYGLCMFVAGYDAFHALYPHEFLPTLSAFRRKVDSDFPFVKRTFAGGLAYTSFLESSYMIFDRLGVSIKQAYLLQAVAQNVESSLLRLIGIDIPVTINDLQPRIMFQKPYSVLIATQMQGGDIIRHVITNDGSPRAGEELEVYLQNGWELGGVLELTRKNKTKFHTLYGNT